MRYALGRSLRQTTVTVAHYYLEDSRGRMPVGEDYYRTAEFNEGIFDPLSASAHAAMLRTLLENLDEADRIECSLPELPIRSRADLVRLIEKEETTTLRRAPELRALFSIN